jgi:hypothetical protein
MPRLTGGQAESLFDQLLPVEVRELPADLAALDRLLADPRLLAPIEQAWAQAARRQGRPTIPMASFVRLMVIKQRTGWGYQTLLDRLQPCTSVAVGRRHQQPQSPVPIQQPGHPAHDPRLGGQQAPQQ